MKRKINLREYIYKNKVSIVQGFVFAHFASFLFESVSVARSP